VSCYDMSLKFRNEKYINLRRVSDNVEFRIILRRVFNAVEFRNVILRRVVYMLGLISVMLRDVFNMVEFTNVILQPVYIRTQGVRERCRHPGRVV